MDLKSTYNKIAKDWMKDHNADTWWVEGTNSFMSFLSPGAVILDVGCGSGVKSDYLIKAGFAVTGIDFSEAMVELARQHVPAGKFFVKDIKQPLALSDQFDGVFAQAVLLHIPKAEVVNVVKNIIEPLKPGGYLYVAVKELKVGRQEEEIVKESDYGYEYERFFSYYTIDELKKYLTDMGMEIMYENITSSGKTGWIQIVARK